MPSEFTRQLIRRVEQVRQKFSIRPNFNSEIQKNYDITKSTDNFATCLYIDKLEREVRLLRAGYDQFDRFFDDTLDEETRKMHLDLFLKTRGMLNE